MRSSAMPRTYAEMLAEANAAVAETAAKIAADPQHPVTIG